MAVSRHKHYLWKNRVKMAPVLRHSHDKVKMMGSWVRGSTNTLLGQEQGRSLPLGLSDSSFGPRPSLRSERVCTLEMRKLFIINIKGNISI